MSPLGWVVYLFGPPRPRVLTWAVDHLMTRVQPVAPIPTARASTTAALTHRAPTVAAPRPQRARITIITADGLERWTPKR